MAMLGNFYNIGAVDDPENDPTLSRLFDALNPTVAGTKPVVIPVKKPVNMANVALFAVGGFFLWKMLTKPKKGRRRR